jgi:hypothetical protein
VTRRSGSSSAWAVGAAASSGRSSAIHAIPWNQGRPQGDIVGVLEQLAGQVDEVYLHIDNDAFDPRVTAWLPIAAATIATCIPARDQQDRTLLADLRIIELFGDYAA